MQPHLGLALNGFRQLVEDIGRFVHPAALIAGLRPRLVQRRPEPQGAADAQRRRCVQTARLQVLEDNEPRGLGLPIAIRQRQQPILPLFVDPDQDQQAQAVVFAAQGRANPIRPPVNVVPRSGRDGSRRHAPQPIPL